MLNKLFGVAAMAAVAYAVVPAYAAQTTGCSGVNLEKTEAATEAMADGPGKFTAEREVAQAQEALLGGNMRSCAMHLSRAAHADHAPYEGMMIQTPAATTTEGPYHSQWNWKPIQPAL